MNRRGFLMATLGCAVAVPVVAKAAPMFKTGDRLSVGYMAFPRSAHLWITHIDYETKTVTFNTVRPRGFFIENLTIPEKYK